MTIQIFQRTVYGNTVCYPTGPLAGHLQALTGKKTLTVSDLRALQGLGVSFETVPDPVTSRNPFASFTP